MFLGWELMRYHVAKTEIVNPSIESCEWKKAEIGYVDKEPWTIGLFPSPKTTFRLLRGPEGLSVYMQTEETNLRAKEEENGDVCNDSCMEFFYKPSPWDTRYFNFEVNPKGVMHLGLGENRFNRIMIAERKALDIVTRVDVDGWSVKYYIPDSFIKEWFPDEEKLSSGNKSHIARANFYKCGDKTIKPHYATWSNIEIKLDDFHVPDFFGVLSFE